MTSEPTKIDFVQFHQPAMALGEYQIHLQHILDDTGSKIPATDLGVTQTFYVAGERFSLPPDQIVDVFPPRSSLGDHRNVFPHLRLSRNTLPWERQAVPGALATPWLGLLVIHDSEKAAVVESTVTLGDLRVGSNTSPLFSQFHRSRTRPNRCAKSTGGRYPETTTRTDLARPAEPGFFDPCTSRKR